MANENDTTARDAEIIGDVMFRLAEDLTRIKRICTQEHPPPMASPYKTWPAGTGTRHSDGTRCVLLNDGDCAILPSDDA